MTNSLLCLRCLLRRHNTNALAGYRELVVELAVATGDRIDRDHDVTDSHTCVPRNLEGQTLKQVGEHLAFLERVRGVILRDYNRNTLAKVMTGVMVGPVSERPERSCPMQNRSSRTGGIDSVPSLDLPPSLFSDSLKGSQA